MMLNAAVDPMMISTTNIERLVSVSDGTKRSAHHYTYEGQESGKDKRYDNSVSWQAVGFDFGEEAMTRHSPVTRKCP